jgi:hypothetical protein
VQVLDPGDGFEPFLSAIHKTIEQSGRGAYYVFDCLSDLVADWYSDQMLGNFFMLTCPYLYDLETIAYFALMRGHHSFHATGPILDTTQLFSDIYRHQGELYVRPLKVQQRYSPTMHMLHVWRNEEFVPVTDSITISANPDAVPLVGVESQRSPTRYLEPHLPGSRGSGDRRTRERADGRFEPRSVAAYVADDGIAGRAGHAAGRALLSLSDVWRSRRG